MNGRILENDVGAWASVTTRQLPNPDLKLRIFDDLRKTFRQEDIERLPVADRLLMKPCQ